MRDRLRPDTLAIDADLGIEPAPDIAPPLHLSTTFAADNPEGLVYTREAQPTRSRLEAVLGALEGGRAVTCRPGRPRRRPRWRTSPRAGWRSGRADTTGRGRRWRP